MMGVTIINKFIKMALLLLSYLTVLITLYIFTDILQGTSLKYVLFLIALTTIYSYLLSAIDKDTFRIKFSWSGTVFYIVGITGFFVLYSNLNQNIVIAWLLSTISTALLITGVLRCQ